MIDDATTMLANGIDIVDTELGKLLSPDDFTSDFAKAEFWSTLTK
jgi:hypothetical protein